MVKYAGGPWARQGRGWWPGATGSAPGLRWVLGPGSPGPQRAGLSPGQEEEGQRGGAPAGWLGQRAWGAGWRGRRVPGVLPAAPRAARGPPLLFLLLLLLLAR